ncbi:DUF4416 family protein [bacterium]|nr:DUF4416 family protein [bacterium]
MQPQKVLPVKLVIGVLYSDNELLKKAKGQLEECYGGIDYISPSFEFTDSDYYNVEMGSPIFRLFLSFEKMIFPNQIAPIKLDTNKLEVSLALDNRRKINLDPGYLDYDKLVLASAKYNWSKIYLENGIYADMTLKYQDHSYLALPWSFPDFKSGIYTDAFLHIRSLYKEQLRKYRKINTKP